MEPAPEESNMTLIRTVLLTSGLVLTVYGGEALAQSSAPGASSTAAASRPLLTLQMPALPDPVRVVLKPATTALLVFDIVDPICKVQPKCTGVMVPAIASLLAQARKAGVFVLYSTRAPTISKWLPEVTPAPADPIITSYAQDRFYNTDLDKTLKAKGITTVILTGWKVSGSVVPYVSWSNTAGLHRRCTRRCQLGHDGLRSGHRPVPNIDSEQRERHERAAQGESFNLEPHGYDHLPVEEPQRSARLLRSLIISRTSYVLQHSESGSRAAIVITFSRFTRLPQLAACFISNQRCDVGLWPCHPKARIISGGRFHPDNCRLIWKLTSGSAG
jgi:Isochorismatase family